MDGYMGNVMDGRINRKKISLKRYIKIVVFSQWQEKN